MNGSWHRYRPGERWRRPPSRARLVLEVPGAVAVCFDAPVVELLEQRAEALHPSLGALGPDLLAPDFDAAEAVRRLRDPSRAGMTIAEALLDQRALAGIGNVYKSELLWIERGLAVRAGRRRRRRDARRGSSRRARRLLLANATAARGPERVTTAGDRGAPGPLYVYGRTGRPCRRCGTPIASRRQGRDLPRTTYWCPTCQARPSLTGRVSSRPMCEHFIARAAEPFRLDELWPFAERLERFGLAGFGWGAAWVATAVRLASYRDVRAFRDDPGRDGRRDDRDDRRARPPPPAVAAVDAVAARTPSRSTTRPAATPSATTATCATTGALRATYRAQGRIHGRADTEVGARWLEDAWRAGRAGRRTSSAALHDRFGGQANLAVLAADGTPHHYAGNAREPGLRVPARADRRRLDRDLLARSIALPLRGPGGDGPPPGPAPVDRRARP